MSHHGPMSSTAPPDRSGTNGQPVAVTRKPTHPIDDWGAVVADLDDPDEPVLVGLRDVRLQGVDDDDA